MSFMNEAGERIQYDAEDLIIKLKEDIRKYGIGKRVRVWCVKAHGVELYTNYNYMEEEPLLREKDSIFLSESSEFLCTYSFSPATLHRFLQKAMP